MCGEGRGNGERGKEKVMLGRTGCWDTASMDEGMFDDLMIVLLIPYASLMRALSFRRP